MRRTKAPHRRETEQPRVSRQGHAGRRTMSHGITHADSDLFRQRTGWHAVGPAFGVCWNGRNGRCTKGGNCPGLTSQITTLTGTAVAAVTADRTVKRHLSATPERQHHIALLVVRRWGEACAVSCVAVMLSDSLASLACSFCASSPLTDAFDSLPTIRDGKATVTHLLTNIADHPCLQTVRQRAVETSLKHCCSVEGAMAALASIAISPCRVGFRLG